MLDGKLEERRALVNTTLCGGSNSLLLTDILVSACTWNVGERGSTSSYLGYLLECERPVLFSRAHHVLSLTKENEKPRWPPKKLRLLGTIEI